MAQRPMAGPMHSYGVDFAPIRENFADISFSNLLSLVPRPTCQYVTGAGYSGFDVDRVSKSALNCLQPKVGVACLVWVGVLPCLRKAIR